MPSPTYTGEEIIDRLVRLTRSPEQDAFVRMLVRAGMPISAIDVLHVNGAVIVQAPDYEYENNQWFMISRTGVMTIASPHERQCIYKQFGL